MKTKTTITKLESLIKTQFSFHARVFVEGFENESGAFGLFYCKETARYVYVQLIKSRCTTQVMTSFAFKRAQQRERQVILQFYKIANN
jgi:hypothetical protein